MDRLGPDILNALPANVAKPAYDRAAVGIGIVHLGIGAFHRAHQAVYTDDALANSGGDWGIVGVSLRSSGVRDRLKPQGGLYTLVERGAGGETLRVIGSVKEVLVAPEDPDAVLARMVAPTTRIVSMTITEKGYLRDAASGALLPGHPDIVHDLAEPDQPRTMHGFVVEALMRRRRVGAEPFTLLCCDNLPANGRALKQVVLAFAKLRDAGLAEWIERHVSFPCTMVDRIVPATTDDDIASTSRALGVEDMAPVVTEPFRQWVIEDRFVAGRPAWERAGAEMVADVAGHEEMKLRLLNGSHSALAYLGYLGGYGFIHQAMADENYVRFVRGLMDEEATPTLEVPKGSDVEAYKASLIERFKNPALHHRTWQIAMDGSQKLPQRLLETARANLAAGRPVGRLALAVAAWMRYVAGTDENGRPIEVSDPLADRFRKLAESANGSAESLARNLFTVREVFGEDLPADPNFAGPVVASLQALFERGARATVAAFPQISGKGKEFRVDAHS